MVGFSELKGCHWGAAGPLIFSLLARLSDKSSFSGTSSFVSGNEGGNGDLGGCSSASSTAIPAIYALMWSALALRLHFLSRQEEPHVQPLSFTHSQSRACLTLPGGPLEEGMIGKLHLIAG